MSAVSTRSLALLFFGSWLVAGCGGGSDPEPTGTLAIADFGAALDDEPSFFDLPFPSDLRLTEAGAPDLTGYPRARSVSLLAPLVDLAEDRPGFPTIPVAYFRFTGPLPSLDADDVIAAETGSPLLLVDVDPLSPDRGALIPVVATSFVPDRFVGDNLLGVAPRPGFVLEPERTYAFVVTRDLGDAEGEPLGVARSIARLARGEAPEGALGEPARTLYAPLFETLDQIGVPREDVAAATVFTTGDVVRELFDLAQGVVDEVDATIEGIGLDPDDGDHLDYCELLAEITLPQYQVGVPPFDTGGSFVFDASGMPIAQRQETIPLVLTLPKVPMPEGGYPLMVYFHGSGGVAAQVVDRGPRPMGGVEAKGEGPAYVIAQHGFAAAGAALPLSPDRLPGASEQEYLNLSNLAAFRDTFRQGTIEQRLMIEALASLRIAPDALGSCAGPELPIGETEYFFDASAMVGMGQSMGGMYVNVIGAVEPALKALVPTGAGGHWSYFILETGLIEGVADLLALLLSVEEGGLSFLHPSLHLLALAWEPAEPLVYMPRLSKRPLPEMAPRPIYQPVGEGDSYFPTPVFDAVALAYGHPMVGDEVWGAMQDVLALVGLDGILDYPVAGNLTSSTGEAYTGAVVQYEGDGFSDPHGIYMQLEDVRYQWGCFLWSAIHGEDGAVILAPRALGSGCSPE
jgi:hypothetical protein